MKNIIVGTAGHIDHGKSALVKALTGTDPDRLEEEKRRGITIDLGFAHLQLTPEIRVGFVDVPGHERFVKNMLAGAGGIDLVLLVVSAEESIKPQTREHFDICRLLGLRHGLVVITKSDLMPVDLLELVRLDVEALVSGSFLEGAPMIAVSALTGEGLDDLRSTLVNVALKIAEKDARGPSRLPIDRAFSIRGFGTVVTGTLVSGAIEKDQELELLPESRRLRVRGIQAYGKSAGRASAGMRAALNLPGIEPREIQRGMVLAEPGRFRATTSIQCRVDLLSSSKPLKSGAPVHFHSGTAELEAEIRFSHARELQPGASAFARIKLAESAVLAPSDRFILRQFSPVITIAGGSVIDPFASRQKRTILDPSRLEILAGSDSPAKAALLIEENVGGLSIEELSIRLGIRPEAALSLARQARALVLDRPGWTVSRKWVENRRQAAVALVKSHHTSQPLSPGISKQELKSGLRLNELFLLDALLSGTPELVAEGERIRHRAHRVVLASAEEEARQKMEIAFAKAGLSVPGVPEVIASVEIDAHKAQTLLRMLLKDGALIRVTGDLVFHCSAIAGLKEILAKRRNESFTVSAFKEWTGISRKYAVPLLEYLDREHVTQRKGDLRTVL